MFIMENVIRADLEQNYNDIGGVRMGNIKAFRRELSKERWDAISAQIQDPALSLSARAALRLKLFLEE